MCLTHHYTHVDCQESPAEHTLSWVSSAKKETLTHWFDFVSQTIWFQKVTKKQSGSSWEHIWWCSQQGVITRKRRRKRRRRSQRQQHNLLFVATQFDGVPNFFVCYLYLPGNFDNNHVPILESSHFETVTALVRKSWNLGHNL